MLITHVELENIKSYRHVSVEFRRGTTAISGANGAGKTTLVEAIGFALFDYLPYNHAQFVREGEKHGRVVVHIIGGDDRPYTVERRCGSGSRWFITDAEANARVEQKADVLDKLHELFGIDRERPLDSLFRDALGVPQGTFTSIFLEAPSKRKQTFDALLQIEDYKNAADYLLEVQKHYKDQIHTQQGEIQRLTYETRELDDWRIALREARQLDEQQKQQNAEWTRKLTQYEERATRLKDQQAQLTALQQQHQYSALVHKEAQKRLLDKEQRLQTARVAQQIVIASRTDFEHYQQAEDMLKRLRQEEQKRNALHAQQAHLQRTWATGEANAQNWYKRLEEVATAREEVVALAPLVEQQVAHEQRREALMQQATRYESLMTELKRLQHTLTTCKQKQQTLQGKISEIEPLVPTAELLQERNTALMQLRIQANERSSKLRELQKQRDVLREKQIERDQTAEKYRKSEHYIALIEEHRQEAEEMPVLQEQYDQFKAHKHRLEGNIEGYTKSRTQSAGGQCPLLHETCLNMKGRGQLSLESYFEGLLKDEHAQLTQVQQQQTMLTERMEQIKKYADAWNKLGQYVDRRDTLAEHLQRIAIELTRLQRDVDGLTQELETLKQVDQQILQAEAAYNESVKADKQVRELSGFSKQIQQLQEQIQQCEADLSGRQQEAEQLKASREQLKEVERALSELHDPRLRSKAQQAIIAQKSHFEQQLQAEQRILQETQSQLQTLSEQLAAYDTLDATIGTQEGMRQHGQQGYQNYLKNEQEAQLLPAREKEHQQQAHVTEQAQRTLQEAEHAYLAAQDAFDEQELRTVSAEVERLRSALASLAETMKHLQEQMSQLERQIEQAEKLLVTLETAQKEYQTLEDLSTTMEHFRKLIKEAAPHVLKAILSDISAEANRIFGEILGDRSAQLSWQNDYEIILRRQSINRTFAQLSGGEQMSAALAVRLALLKKLSTLNLAFFDEPTQNMDELRRMNLAEQIRRVRGFDQLIIISHDDTFEQGLDSLVRLHKVNGETYLQGEDEERIPQREQVQIYAS